MRIIIYTGKGGVGKTSIAASTAVELSKKGKRTLVVSTDAAHSLSDSFDLPIGHEPTPLMENLWGLEIDSLYEMEKNWGAVKEWMVSVLTWAKLDDITTEEMVGLPGGEELFSLLEISKHTESGEYDVIIIDCAPTGETLRLLGSPDKINWWFKKIFPLEKLLATLARPFSKIVTGGLEMPSDEVFASVVKFMEKLITLQDIITNSDICSVRIVVNPEKMVIAEARRSFTHLNLFGFNTDAVIINKFLPEEAATGYMANWRASQNIHIQEIHDCFNPITILSVPLMDSEAFGISSLEKIASHAFSNCDIGEVLYKGTTLSVRKENDIYIMELAVPFVSKEQISMSQTGDELTLQVGAYRRKVLLPRLLLGKQITSAKLIENKLTITFEKEKKNEETNED